MSEESNPDERLIYMANQIARNTGAEGEENSVAVTADHIRKFWDPRMRARIMAVLERGGEGLEPVTRRALARLK